MKKKYFYKKNKYLWLLTDIFVWIVCIAIADFLGYLIGKVHMAEVLFVSVKWLAFIFKVHGITAKIAVLFFFLLMVGVVLVISALFTFPILGIYYGVSRAIRKNQKARLHYDVIKDIDYFRDEFKELSPADISLLADLKIERGKDITATLLSLEQKKWIKIENNQIVPLEGYGEPLLFSEQELLNMIRTNKMNSNALGRWENASVQAAVRQGLLASNKDKGRLLLKMGMFILMFFVCISIFSGAAEDTDRLGSKIDELLDTPEMDKYEEIDTELLSEQEQMALLQEQLELPEVQQSIVIIMLMFMELICGIMIFILPILTIAYLLSYVLSKPRYKRTKKGKILTEELAGMRNFIHDFSNLKEADKEQLVLWDNFLVYAVVLEENENIVKEIGRIRKVDLSKFSRLG